MGALFIAGAGTDIGKTYVTAALARQIRADGGAVRVLKPVVSGVAALGDPAFMTSDTAVLLKAAGLPVDPAHVEACSPWRFAAPLAPDRAGLLHALATLPEHPDSLPINDLMPTTGTPLGQSAAVGGIEFVRTIAVARLVCPKAVVRLSAGREHMSPEQQALCFLAGANSIFVGAKLLTTRNPDKDVDARLFADLGLKPMGAGERTAAALA